MRYKVFDFVTYFSIAAVLLILVIGCEGENNGMNSEEHEKHWSYEGDTGPDHWGDLDTEYYACSEGKNQSPINIDTNNVIKNDLPDIQFFYQPSSLDLVNNGHTIQANVPEENYIKIGGVRYDLIQFHFHSLSEHTVNGNHFPIEAHFVHKSAAGDLAVIGVFIKEGTENQAYKQIWNNLPEHEEDEYALSTPVNSDDLIPADRRTYRYSGSLTTPPCSEGVRWFIMATPIQMSSEQIAAFEEIYNRNYRPILPQNAREVLYDITSN